MSRFSGLKRIPRISPMKWIVAAAALACGVTPMTAPPLLAQDLKTSQIEIAYGVPRDANHKAIYERLKKRAVLEDLQQFLSPLKLPRKLTVRLDQCGGPVPRYRPGGAVTVCYEYIEEIERLAYGPLRRDMIAGSFVQELLHQTGRGVFDSLKVPVWGRVSDAADNLAAFIMLQFGKEVAIRTVRGSHMFFSAIITFGTDVGPSDIRSTAAQRYYNYMCIAYGADPETFNYLVDIDERRSTLPRHRRAWCPWEYIAVRKSFERYIRPHVDEAKLAKVKTMDWLRPDDGR
jgi:Putative metallopeptidase